jgi:hypothetical protein
VLLAAERTERRFWLELALAKRDDVALQYARAVAWRTHPATQAVDVVTQTHLSTLSLDDSIASNRVLSSWT